MALRCGCPDEADDIVFGSVHNCAVDPSLAVSRPVPWWKPKPVPEGHAAECLQAELDRLEPLYRHVLAPDELEDR